MILDRSATEIVDTRYMIWSPLLLVTVTMTSCFAIFLNEIQDQCGTCNIQVINITGGGIRKIKMYIYLVY